MSWTITVMEKQFASPIAATMIFFVRKDSFFFSTEAKDPASALIIDILRPIEEEFRGTYYQTAFSNQLDSIAIIPICVPQIMIAQGFGKERKYVSLKKRIADIRLQIPYDEFINTYTARRIALCKENIHKAAQYIAYRDHTFKIDAFLSAIDEILARYWEFLMMEKQFYVNN